MKHAVLVLIGLLVSGTSAGEELRRPPREEGASPRLVELLGNPKAAGYAMAETVRAFEFPADHGPHPDYRNEWWYVTGNLDDAAGRRFGFELTLFRFALAPPGTMPDEHPRSAWRTREVYIGHFAITDVARGDFHVAQRYARGALSLAGATATPLRIWLEDWSLSAPQAPDGPWQLVAENDEMGLDLILTPLKRPVLNGNKGLSQKSGEPGNASYYYSITRLATDGTLRVQDREYAVSGLSWLDREWGSSALASDQAGWDWFALQLTDGSDLMFYSLRKRDGTRDEHSAGTWVSPRGDSIALHYEDVDIQVLDYWDSPLGGRYPGAWRVIVPMRGLDLRITPVLAGQELDATLRYWEGAVDVAGTQAGRAIDGRGYVELTGYAD